MSVYLDELFIINFIACLFMLIIMRGILPVTRRAPRLAAAAAAGAAGACVRFLSGNMLFAALEIAVPLIALSKRTVSGVVLFELIKYALSGLSVLIISFFGANTAVIRGGVIYFDVLPRVFLPMLGLTLLAGSLLSRLLRRRKRDRFVTVILSRGDKTVRLSALIDSGNLLKDPYDGSDVIVTEKTAAAEICAGACRLLPFNALGTQNGLIKAYKADSAEIVETGKIMKNITVAVCGGKLSKNKRIQALAGESFGEE